MKIHIALAALVGLAASNSLSSRGRYQEQPPLPQIGQAVKDGLGNLQGNIPYKPGTHAKAPSKNQIGGMPYLNRPRPRPKNEGRPGTPGNPLGPRKKPGRIYTRCEVNAISCVERNTRRLSKLADGIAQAEFKRLTNIYGLPISDKPNKSGKGGLKLSLSELRARFVGFRSSKSQISGKKWVTKLAAGAFTVATELPGYIISLVDAIKSDATDLEKAAVATSIIPFVGCTTRNLANLERQAPKTISTALCYTGDIALFTPLWFLKPVLDALAIVFDFDENMDVDWVMQQRHDAWVNRYEQLINYLNSEDYRNRVMERYSLEISTHLFALSEQSATLYIGELVADEQSDSVKDAKNAAQEVEDAWMESQQDICARLLDTERRFDEEIPLETANWMQKEYFSFMSRHRISYFKNRMEAWSKRENFLLSQPVFRVPSSATMKKIEDNFYKQVYTIDAALQDYKPGNFHKKDVEAIAREVNKMIPRDHGVCNGPPLKMGAAPPGNTKELGYEKIIEKVMAEEVPRVKIFTDAYFRGIPKEYSAPLGKCIDTIGIFNDRVSSFRIDRPWDNILCIFYRQAPTYTLP
ncbi:hypothetical protein CDD81_4870 [Ophiocordyceps australis]|uniref:Uncharacterized protein n=1 Tax=Ophiocordyceps australis TaxID=1399860 RepID=A0A2C5Y966_9HYPO|nr:hypothetical protein CDD81_4870 [Ophiocordyceps australis]